MDLFSDLIAAVQSDLVVGDESSLFNETKIKLYINRSYRKAGALFPWPETEAARKGSTRASKEDYLIPANFRPESIFRLEVDSNQYGELPDGSPMNYRDYLNWRNDPNNSGSTDKKWAVSGRKLFIYPLPTTDGDYNYTLWGIQTVDALVDDADLTIFSYSMPECNDAICKETVAMLKATSDDIKTGEFFSVDAKQTLILAWNKIKNAKVQNEKVLPFFDVPDYFGRPKSRDLRGRFDV